jgi:hypothetical protein
LQDDLQDMMDESNEVQELLSRSYATPDGIDDADLEAGNLIWMVRLVVYFNIHCRIRNARFGAV